MLMPVERQLAHDAGVLAADAGVDAKFGLAELAVLVQAALEFADLQSDAAEPRDQDLSERRVRAAMGQLG